MKKLFDEVSYKISKNITHTYSTSFSLGIQFLEPKIRGHIHAIYGFVRLADEIVDSFEGYDKTRLLQKFREDTQDALESKISCNPVLHSFQQTVHQFQIDRELIDLFMDSMAMDLNKVLYTRDSYDQYILGSAEVVGLMCLHIFTEGNKALYDHLKPAAMKLGAAFQKVNFLRDMRSDYDSLGRMYFPGVNFGDFDDHTKFQIEEEIEADFKAALRGIRQLPSSSRGGVYLAYAYYRSLFKKIRRLRTTQMLAGRIRINNGTKLGIMLNSFLENKLNWI